jgi:acetolactate synthase-1/3 small subunit
MADHDRAVLVIHVHDRPGALAKIANVFYRRGLNIRTLTVGPTDEPDQSRMEVAAGGRRADWERIALAIGNLVDVVSVELSDTAA